MLVGQDTAQIDGTGAKYLLLGNSLTVTDKEKDIEVMVDSELSFQDHISEKVKKANQSFGLLRRTFQFMNSKTFLPLNKSLVRSQLDYASSVWSPVKVKDIDELESVQRRATKSLPGMQDMSYQDRLQKLNLPTLTYRRLRGDMIELYKITNGIYDKDFVKLKMDAGIRSG
ncbi:uncharacterized protein LOC132548490 [Ylistrum balloti]|uniref:uncharacterized protein LOC132548490 n=1 Tax=Ylistrum balloti TaxID=509963 RepID=UPI0029058E65|nr:uncharacterized protein LOC132548490 [Ylistrum balloti]